MIKILIIICFLAGLMAGLVFLWFGFCGLRERVLFIPVRKMEVWLGILLVSWFCLGMFAVFETIDGYFVFGFVLRAILGILSISAVALLGGIGLGNPEYYGLHKLIGDFLCFNIRAKTVRKILERILRDEEIGFRKLMENYKIQTGGSIRIEECRSIGACMVRFRMEDEQSRRKIKRLFKENVRNEDGADTSYIKLLPFLIAISFVGVNFIFLYFYRNLLINFFRGL